MISFQDRMLLCHFQHDIFSDNWLVKQQLETKFSMFTNVHLPNLVWNLICRVGLKCIYVAVSAKQSDTEPSVLLLVLGMLKHKLYHIQYFSVTIENASQLDAVTCYETGHSQRFVQLIISSVVSAMNCS
jgi:hypothetical protein